MAAIGYMNEIVVICQETVWFWGLSTVPGKKKIIKN